MIELFSLMISACPASEQSKVSEDKDLIAGSKVRALNLNKISGNSQSLCKDFSVDIKSIPFSLNDDSVILSLTMLLARSQNEIHTDRLMENGIPSVFNLCFINAKFIITGPDKIMIVIITQYTFIQPV